MLERGLTLYFAVTSYYSARLYRSVEYQGQVSAVFCMSLYHPMYMKVKE